MCSSVVYRKKEVFWCYSIWKTDKVLAVFLFQIGNALVVLFFPFKRGCLSFGLQDWSWLLWLLDTRRTRERESQRLASHHQQTAAVIERDFSLPKWFLLHDKIERYRKRLRKKKKELLDDGRKRREKSSNA